jgi:hypothetical protein
MNGKQSLGQRWTASQPSKAQLFWACVGSAVATLAVGFFWGGWVTGGTAEAMAKEAAAGARTELAAAICVDKFKSGSDASVQMVALKELQGWSRGSFVEKGGWAVMPDKTEPVTRTAKLCAEQLAAIELPAPVAAVPATQ